MCFALLVCFALKVQVQSELWVWAGLGTQILNLRAENNFPNMLKIVQKLGNLRDFWTIFNIFAKLIFALKFNICWLLTHSNNIYIKVLLQDKK